MSFTKGQLTFAAIFFVAFVITMIIAYSKDKKVNKSYFKGTYLVLLSIIVIYLIFWFYVRLIY